MERKVRSQAGFGANFRFRRDTPNPACALPAPHRSERSKNALAAQTGMRFYDAETKRRLTALASDRETVVAELCSASLRRG